MVLALCWFKFYKSKAEYMAATGRAEPVAGSFAFRDMGALDWLCVASPQHPLASREGLLLDDQLRPYPALCMDDTSRSLPKRDTWTLDNQRRMMVPDWATALNCLTEGLCVGMAPAHQVQPLIERGLLVALHLQRPFPSSPSCIAWVQDNHSPAMSWLLDYLGDTPTLNQEWLNDTTVN